ncbi:hypothetical protein ACQPZX_25145 [Actinoplanes sp. CA-142083]|uniref:hypothetical protein n=1 Tax=Actinoplanes sp. CA-142083 TaxID=3239903 RepID=UPI003D92BFF9
MAAPAPEPQPTTETTVARLLADIGVVVGAATAVLYYFGWVRTRFQARELGFDVSALNLTTADYLLKSLNVLFLPLILLVIGVLAGVQAHRRFVAPRLAPGRSARALRAARGLSLAWIPLALAGLGLLFSPLNGYVIPLTLTLAVLLAGYSRVIRRAVTGVDPWPPAVRIAVAALLTLAVFWSTERVARTMGTAFGADFAADPGQLPAVVVYSDEDLRLDGDGVATTRMPGTDAAYQFRYAGLFLLERSGDRYFFITVHPGRVVILRETDSVRMEFVKTDGGDGR